MTQHLLQPLERGLASQHHAWRVHRRRGRSTRCSARASTPALLRAASASVLVELRVDEQRLAGRRRAPSARAPAALVLVFATRQRVDDDRRAVLQLGASAARSAPFSTFFGQLSSRSCAAAARNGAALAPQRVADLAHARAAGALLPPRLLAAPLTSRAGLGLVRAAALGGVRAHHRLVNQVGLDAIAEDLVAAARACRPSCCCSLRRRSSGMATSCPSCFSWLRLRLRLRGNRLANHHVAAGRARHRAAHESRFFSASTLHAPSGCATVHPLAAHVAGQRMPLHDARRDTPRRRSSRARGGTSSRGSRAPPREAVALHDALEALALAGADRRPRARPAEDRARAPRRRRFGASPPFATLTSRRTRVGGTPAFL